MVSFSIKMHERIESLQISSWQDKFRIGANRPTFHFLLYTAAFQIYTSGGGGGKYKSTYKRVLSQRLFLSLRFWPRFDRFKPGFNRFPLKIGFDHLRDQACLEASLTYILGSFSNSDSWIQSFSPFVGVISLFWPGKYSHFLTKKESFMWLLEPKYSHFQPQFGSNSLLEHRVKMTLFSRCIVDSASGVKNDPFVVEFWPVVFTV